MKKYSIFKRPYVLVEDLRRKHQPFYKEYDDRNPKLLLDSPPLGCPFVEGRRCRAQKKKAARSGMCEVCYTKYANYREHIADTEHREYAVDDRNYREVDAFIAELCREETEFCTDADF